MKKITAALLALILIVSVLALPVSATGDILLIASNPNANKQQDVFVTSFKTCNDPENYLKLDIEGTALKFSGMVMNPEIKYLYVLFGNEKSLIEVIHGSRFNVKYDLSDIKYTSLEFEVYTGRSKTSEFISAFYGRDIVLEKRNGEWGIVIDRNVYESNKKIMAGWVDEKSSLEIHVSERVERAAKLATADLESDYDKARAIHGYVADLLHYDLDYANHKSPSTYVAAEEVFDKKIAVCEGYTNLTIALLRSIGIPAIFVEGYALGIDSVNYDWDKIDFTSSNHSWVEAYVDGRWVVMDPTWDSKNTYENGKKVEIKSDFYRFFDMSDEMLASNHLIISRPNVFGQKGISDWALPEAKEAYRYGLITSDCVVAMPDAITRLEFCDLVMNMLSVKLGKSVEKILADKNLTINDKAFVDTDYYNILAANALGIVNGKEEGKFDPEGTIKRQEAAAMLQRSAVNVLGVEKPNSTPITFTDEETFASWGRDAISFVSASADKNGRKVMGGKEAGKFAPNDLYTKEQSVLTILRLYTAY